MTRALKKVPRWEVHVFRPNGWFVCKVQVNGQDAQVAKERAKKAVYKMGKLAHFYSYVTIDRKIQSPNVGHSIAESL